MSKETIFESDGGNDILNSSDNQQFENFRRGQNSAYVDQSIIPPVSAFYAHAGKDFFPMSVSEDYSYYSEENRMLETPLAKIMRIKYELSTLRSDLDNLNQTESNGFWNQVQREAMGLLRETEDLQLALAKKSTLGTKVDDIRKVLVDLQEQEKASVSTSNSMSNLAPLRSSLKSQNSCDALSPNSQQSAASLLEMEKRIAFLEKVVGVNGTEIRLDSSALPVEEALAKIEKKLQLLTPSGLDVLREKSAALRREMETLKRSKLGNASVDFLSRLESVSQTSAKVEPLIDQLPALVMRMDTLKDVHQSALTFNERLTESEESVQLMKEELRINQENLRLFRSALMENMEIFRKNASAIDRELNRR